MANDDSSPRTEWSLAEAKDRLSEVVRRAAVQGPQSITVRGEKTAVLLSAKEYAALTSVTSRSLKDLILSTNYDDVDLARDPRPAHDIEL